MVLESVSVFQAAAPQPPPPVSTFFSVLSVFNAWKPGFAFRMQILKKEVKFMQIPNVGVWQKTKGNQYYLDKVIFVFKLKLLILTIFL
jgi:hypothetical protein